MKRLLQFDVTENSYIILESGTTVFEIPFQGLRFDARAFYQGIYSEGRSADIKLENIATVTNAKIGYVFRWLNDIVQEIHRDLGEEDDGQDDFPEVPSAGDSVSETKTIILFDMGVCAGIGDFMGSDYALRISGHSMEPTLADGSIVLVKAIEEPADGQIVVVNVDGQSMVKRYRVINGQAQLVPDNDCGEFKSIILGDGIHFFVQGRVLCQNASQKL